ncbi:MAG: hypothetical protein GKC53_01920 [Neisseriaceae bacterium]|nr:MAG: hypothetical protein GKC53_01920 [Neisseriaceae bacterium]
MVNLEEFNHAHDGVIKQIDFDFDYDFEFYNYDYNKKQEIRIIYAVSVDVQQPNGEFKKVGYDYFRMIFNNPCSQQEPIFNIKCTFIYEIVQIESNVENYSCWRIRMCEKEQYIDIYAEDLSIEKITNPFD